MKEFINLSPEESKGLDISIYNNAQVLFDSAILLFKNNNTNSVATSLLILSSEELIKAVIVKLHSEKFRIYRIGNAKLFFTNHQIRHEIAQLIETAIGLFEGMDIWDKQKQKPSLQTKSSNLNFWGNLINDVIMSSQPFLKSTTRIKSLQDFNKWKNQGFYVDFRDKLVEPSKEIDEKKYSEVREITLRIFKFYRFLEELYDPLNTSLSEKEKFKYQEDLKILIDSIFVEEKAYEFKRKKF